MERWVGPLNDKKSIFIFSEPTISSETMHVKCTVWNGLQFMHVLPPQYSKMMRNYFVSQLESLRQIHHPTGCEYMEHVLLELVKKDFTVKNSSSPAIFEIYEVSIMCSIKCRKVAGLVYARVVVRGVCAHVMVSGWKGRLHKHKQKLESPPFNAVVASYLDFQGSSIICNTMAKQKDS